jgi:HSP20 family molecular chaperone IbpA
MTAKTTGGRAIAPSKPDVEMQKSKLMENDREEHTEGQLALDIYQTTTHIVIVAPIAGVKLSDIDVSVTEDV